MMVNQKEVTPSTTEYAADSHFWILVNQLRNQSPAITWEWKPTRTMLLLVINTVNDDGFVTSVFSVFLYQQEPC